MCGVRPPAGGGSVTGRLDAVDLKSDMLLIALHDADGGVDLPDLHAHLSDVDMEPFVFDGYDDVPAVVEDLRMFASIGFATADDDGVHLTERGTHMADLLMRELDDAQADALAVEVPA